MQHARSLLLVTCWTLTPSVAHSQAWSDSLGTRLQARILRVPNAVVGVALHDLTSGARLSINGDSLFHAASTMKIPVMIQYFRDLDAGRLSRDQSVLFVNRFGSIVDGSPYQLDAADDSDSLMYRKVGQRVAVSELVHHMITRSSNLATNAVIALVGANAANATAHQLGARTIRVLRGVEDNKAFEAGLNNVTSPLDLAALLEAIESGRAASPSSCQDMLAILEQQEFNDEIPAGLPAGTRVAHKTGSITGVLHDAALVFPPNRRPYVLVVLTRGIPDAAVARSLIVDLSRDVWAAVTSR